MSVPCNQGFICTKYKDWWFNEFCKSLTYLELTGLLYDDLQLAVLPENGFTHLRDPPGLFLLRGGVSCQESEDI